MYLKRTHVASPMGLGHPLPGEGGALLRSGAARRKMAVLAARGCLHTHSELVDRMYACAQVRFGELAGGIGELGAFVEPEDKRSNEVVPGWLVQKSCTARLEPAQNWPAVKHTGLHKCEPPRTRRKNGSDAAQLIRYTSGSDALIMDAAARTAATAAAAAAARAFGGARTLGVAVSARKSLAHIARRTPTCVCVSNSPFARYTTTQQAEQQQQQQRGLALLAARLAGGSGATATATATHARRCFATTSAAAAAAASTAATRGVPSPEHQKGQGEGIGRCVRACCARRARQRFEC